MFGFLKKKDEPAAAPEEGKASWAERLKAGLAKTRAALNTPLGEIFSRARIDDELLEDLESTLLQADCGVEATQWLLDELKARVRREKIESPAQLRLALTELLERLLAPLDKPIDFAAHKPFIIMVAGINGSGKTTSIGKLAHHFQAQGRSVLLAAGDTFRAAALEQLATWGARVGADVVAQGEGADPASVAHDALMSAKARGADLLIVDTAGRLHTQQGLMDELKKVQRVLAKLEPGAPHEVLLVLDGSQGQNALVQARAFHAALGVTGLVVTKLDGSAKGGVLLAIVAEFGLPVRALGVGETAEDLVDLRPAEFAAALVGAAA